MKPPTTDPGDATWCWGGTGGFESWDLRRAGLSVGWIAALSTAPEMWEAVLWDGSRSTSLARGDKQYCAKRLVEASGRGGLGSKEARP